MNFRLLLPLFLFPFLCAACAKEEIYRSPQGNQAEMAQVSVCCKVKGTKSTLVVGEDQISDYCIFFYRGGNLYAEASGRGDSISNVSLEAGCSYDVFAFANTGGIHAPRTVGEMLSFRYRIPEFSQIASGGLPMAWHREDAIVPEAGKKNVLEISFERLVAKYCVRIEKKLSHCDFTVHSAVLHQSAQDITPFIPESVPEFVIDGDEASWDDVDLLNGGSTATFYTLENVQGRLMEGNADPWKKTPDKLGEKGEMCTYLEIAGLLSTPGASAQMTYRMYLGKDNCSDFSVVRNTESSLTLFLSDETMFDADWKIEKVFTEENRSMYFEEGVAYVKQGSGWTEITSFVMDPPGQDVRVSTGSAIPGLESKVEEGKLYMRSSYYGQSAISTWVCVETWDGELQAEGTVIVEYDPGSIPDFALNQPHYVGQWGTADFSAVDISRWSLMFSCGSNLWTISKTSNYPMTQRTIGRAGVMEHYLNYVGRKYHMHAIMDGEMSQLYIYWGSHSISVGGGVQMPLLTLKDSHKLILTEEGNTSSIAGRPYDVSMDFCLTSPEGQVLKLESFAAPEDLIGYRDIERPYKEILETTISGYQVKPSSASDVAWFAMDAEELMELGEDPQDCLLRIFFRGQGSVEAGQTSNKSGVEVRIGSSVFNADVELRR